MFGIFFIFAINLNVMEGLIYIASDNSAMLREDLINLMSFFYKFHPGYSNWDFDSITGGENNFLNYESYKEMKKFYDKHEIK